jgi:hypothetical protein
MWKRDKNKIKGKNRKRKERKESKGKKDGRIK